MIGCAEALVSMGLRGPSPRPVEPIGGADDPLPGLDGVAPFPLEVLPTPLRAWVRAAAAALPCPPDFLAVPALVGAGIAWGRICGSR